MQFEWDEEKRRENLRKHRIDFRDVTEVFFGPMVVELDDRQDYGEERWRGIGLLRSIEVVVVWVEKTGKVFRIISARKAKRHERERYEQSRRD